MKKFSLKRVLKIVVVILAIAALGVGGYALVTSRPAKIWLASTISDNRNDFLPCQQLPFYPQARKALDQHKDIVEKIKQAGAFDVAAEEIKCPSADGSFYFTKGDIVIQYDTHAQRIAIEKLIGDNFFGIPWRGENH